MGEQRVTEWARASDLHPERPSDPGVWVEVVPAHQAHQTAYQSLVERLTSEEAVEAETISVELTRTEADCVALAASYVLATVDDIGPEARSGRDKLRAALKETAHA